MIQTGAYGLFLPQDLRMVFTVLRGPCQGRGSACCRQLPILSHVSGSGFPTNPGGNLGVWGSFTCLPHIQLYSSITLKSTPPRHPPLFLL